MYLYNKSKKQLSEIPVTSFKDHKIHERQDLEKWVKENPSILGEELYILTSEYDKFDKTKERLDLLAIDQSGNRLCSYVKRSLKGYKEHHNRWDKLSDPQYFPN